MEVRDINVFELTIELMKIPSVSGNEQKVGAFIGEYLGSLGYDVELQEVVDGRKNVIAVASDNPELFFSTHMDTVPPFIPPTEDREKIYGRGSCDAKGIIASQIAAAEQLRAAGETRIGLLFTVDEEESSLGSKAANDLPVSAKCRYMINGEPTDNDLGIGSKGSLRMRLSTSGKAAHSAYPEMGESAIEKMVEVLSDVIGADLPGDEFFGDTTLNVGTISGGLKTNVVPPSAEAGLHIRLATDDGPVIERLNEIVGDRGELETMSCSLPVKMLEVEGFKQKVVRFTTDIPQLTNWGTPLLLGPGSILDAHTSHEYVKKEDLVAAVELYVNLGRRLLDGQVKRHR
ncbi:MAG: M20/M25/M40 family metallo-hydrolase [Acidobacteria bacterium]|nr:MAG: M20/M25/M40 family metallo-hydrolase [Acidobacteriota bacterium]REK02725.1 MAG: M20/M25/M40 family metallo-hydrolase [Acidobacteriota bacterium]REK13470.1 MAG: M20/M25/M40 family metallo-hydrolase [Acidobacteriota bacterium]REK41464.1 MAG: M20/M25/M40 family metallo-hydrolase [Acidobacteriota bacterium]